jgi:hypothetical protein
MPDLLDQLREQRTAVRSAQDEILTRAATESRDLTAEELADHTARSVEVRDLDDSIEQLLADQVAELRAAQVRAPGRSVPREPVLTREQSVADWCQARGMFDGHDQELSFDRYLRGLATPDGMVPSTNGPWPRQPSGPVGRWSRRRCPRG